MLTRFALGVLAFAAFSQTARAQAPDPTDGDEDNPPQWPQDVHIFSPEDQENISITEVIADLTKELNNVTTGHFSTRRLALLFKPGTYRNVSVQVGYYTQVLGLGNRANDTLFTDTAKGIYSPADVVKPDPGSLDNFWRSAENFKTNATEGMLWSVSQAAPIRRVHVTGDLTTDERNAWASGGFLANVQVDGKTKMEGQQQWMSRNSDLGSHDRHDMGGIWSMVFVGCTGAPASRYPKNDDGDVGITNIAVTPVVAEKPFITIDDDGKYFLNIPPVVFDSVGSNVNLYPSQSGTRIVPFDKVYVADDEVQADVATQIQFKLDAGKHVVLSPGIYYLSKTLTLKFPGQVLLGIGMATLHPPPDGTPCVRVYPGIGNVRVAGLMLAASQVTKTDAGDVSTLLEWGLPTEHDAGKPQQPGVLSDIFARVGGPDIDRTVGVDKMIRIFSGNVIGDNLWLWRADHALLDPDEPPQDDIPKNPKKEFYHLVEKGEYPCEAGLEVFGDHVTMYGLFVEHTLGNMTQWRGNAGKVYFYQSELPYDVNSSYGDANIAGYVVADHIKSHSAHGVGVYTYFRDHTVNVPSGILAPRTDGVRFANAFTRFLNGNGGLNSVLNGMGGRAEGSGSRMWRLASSLGDEDPELCPVDPAEKNEHTVLIVVIVILVIILCLTAFYAYFLRASALKRSDPSSQVQGLSADAVRSPVGQALSLQEDTGR